MKPIVPGCMVVIIKGWRAGQFGTALRFLPKGVRVTVEYPEPHSLIVPNDAWVVSLHHEPGPAGFDEVVLMRIDGHEPTAADYELLALETSEG